MRRTSERNGGIPHGSHRKYLLPKTGRTSTSQIFKLHQHTGAVPLPSLNLNHTEQNFDISCRHATVHAHRGTSNSVDRHAGERKSLPHSSWTNLGIKIIAKLAQNAHALSNFFWEPPSNGMGVHRGASNCRLLRSGPQTNNKCKRPC